jgi:hypothetical protein
VRAGSWRSPKQSQHSNRASHEGEPDQFVSWRI